MEITFSQEAAEKACNELSEYSENIESRMNSLNGIREGIRSCWSGHLQNTVLTRVSGKDETLTAISNYVKGLNQTITACRKNYQLTENENVQVMHSILDLFA